MEASINVEKSDMLCGRSIFNSFESEPARERLSESLVVKEDDLDDDDLVFDDLEFEDFEEDEVVEAKDTLLPLWLWDPD
jgi:hypothetical protein